MAQRGDLEIRRLSPGDGEQLTALLREAFAEEFGGGGTEDAAVQRQVRAAGWAQQPGVRHALALLGTRFAYFVAVYQGRLIGSAAVGGGRLYVISSVAVLPEYRRAGIARALVERCEAFAREQGHDRVALDVLSHNDPALRLYESLGYGEYHRFRAYELPVLSAHLAAPVVRGFWLEPLSPKRSAAFAAVERAAMPPRYYEIGPTLRDRFIRSRALSWWEQRSGGLKTHRRVLVDEGRAAGFLLSWAVGGQAEGRIDFPLVLPEANEALPGALVDAIGFLQGCGRTSARVDVSEDRPDQHAVLEAMGLRHRWTFVQMAHWLTRPVRIPVRVSETRRLPYEEDAETDT